jgi:hypothetical protein
MADDVIEMPEPAKFYDRAVYPLEFWPYSLSSKGTIVRVFLIGEGCRARVPFQEGSQPNKERMQAVRQLRKVYRKLERR